MGWGLVVALSWAVLARAARPVLISTDPGVDDSIAILLAAASPELDLRGICVNFGSLHNVSQLADNALSILALAGREDVPVYLGAADPLAATFHDLGGTSFHGMDGLGGAPRPAHSHKAVNTSYTAAEMIVHACRTWSPPPVLVSLSPLTNIALALALEPRLPQLCPSLYLMGGTILEPGNVSPVAEANIANDAEAARRVFAAGFETHIAPLDVTMSTWLQGTYLESLRGRNHVGDFVWNITRFYTAAYHRIGGFEDGMPLHDPSAMMFLLRPDLYWTRRWAAEVDVSAFPAATRGMVIADRRGGPLSPPAPQNVTLHFALRGRVPELLEFLRERLLSLPKRREIYL